MDKLRRAGKRFVDWLTVFAAFMLNQCLLTYLRRPAASTDLMLLAPCGYLCFVLDDAFDTFDAPIKKGAPYPKYFP